jgi:hypothetical protein
MDHYSELQEQSTLVGVLLEQHAYWDLFSCVRFLPTQAHILDTSRAAVLKVDNLRRYSTFGVLFGCAADLYQLIPSICQLAMDRRKVSSDPVIRDLQCSDEYNRLHGKVIEWQHVSGFTSGSPSTTTTASIAAGEFLRVTLLLFLQSAYRTNLKELKQLAKSLVDRALRLIDLIVTTPWFNSIFAPLIVVATFMEKAEDQRKVMMILRSETGLCKLSRKYLQQLWEAPDDVYGLDGWSRVSNADPLHFVFG